MNIQGWFPLGVTHLISLLSEGLWRVLYHHSLKASILWCSAFLMVHLSHPYMTTGKTIALTIQNFVGKIMSLVFNMLSRFVIAFLPRRKHLFEFRKGRGTRDQIANICWIIEKAREFQKNIYFWFIDYVKAFDYVDHSKLWKILKAIGIPDLLICLLRNLSSDQEATVRTRHGTMDWFQIGKGVHQGCILSPWVFNFYAE